MFYVLCNQREDTPLHCACYNGPTELVTLLTSHGADVNAVDYVSLHTFTYTILTIETKINQNSQNKKNRRTQKTQIARKHNKSQTQLRKQNSHLMPLN